jgi:hypothetical protein
VVLVTWAVNLCLALAMGVVPTHVCLPSCGEGGGVVLLGTHAHDGHARGECGHDHGAPTRPDDGDRDHVPCCEDAPSGAVAPSGKAPLPAPSAAVCLDRADVAREAPPALAPCADPAGLPADAVGPPPGVVGVVLLR